MEPGPSFIRWSPSQNLRVDRFRYSSTSTLLQSSREDNGQRHGPSEDIQRDDQESPSNRLSHRLSSGSTLFDIPPIQLVFDRNSVINATLLTREGPAYRVETNRNVTKTSLRDLHENKLVAVWKRRDIFPDIVQFEHRRKKLRLRKWLKKFSNEEIGGHELTIEDMRFLWKSHHQHRVALFADQDLHNPLAHCRMLQDSHTISLVIQACVSGATKVEIIMSFLVVEHRQRMKEKRLRLHAGGAFLPV
ncbi:hypothetical protein CPB83DRAFT_890120 [Crepidotus variabilis]|uniref:DUF6593 domain-containing protein n=1 Tax=Crepidotus variabilis TaxID=179855 RepID=A0A9P6ES38_9AGAR|nr:hypothetical protein CPB83DRAFT_890120 [Crepidotus variabilis]